MDEIKEKYINELYKKFPSKEALIEEIAKLNIELNLPKGTEHFLSDLHGEAEAFEHIMRSASGVIKNKIDLLFSDELNEDERSKLATLVYYPEENLGAKGAGSYSEDYICKTTKRLIKILKTVGDKYSKEYITNRLVGGASEYFHTITSILWGHPSKSDHSFENTVIQTFLRTDELFNFIISLCKAIRVLVIHRLHIVGDIFDRGPRPDLIIEELIKFGSVDIEWGNHDVLWMGAAAGSEVCIATVLNNSITYKNLDVIEFAYGISLRPLALFAEEEYGNSSLHAFLPKGEMNGDRYTQDNDILIAKMHKAIAIIQFKLEELVIERNPRFEMDDRMMLKKIDRQGNVFIGGICYALKDQDFKNIKRTLTEKEKNLIIYLKEAFCGSEKLQRHVRFLYEKGSMYRIYNGNLLFHGCIPLDRDGEFLHLGAANGAFGKDLMDICDKKAREGYFSKDIKIKKTGEDFLWFLWCGKNSPLSAREKIAAFERLLISEKETHSEPKNSYYLIWKDGKIAEKILNEFGLHSTSSKIINGHIPVNKGEDPVKSDGRLILIDGGFCRAYHDVTGIAGYTLIYNADGMKLFAHNAFPGKVQVLNGKAMHEATEIVLEKRLKRMRIRDCDRGAEIREELCDLLVLLEKYKSGLSK